jgi:hypothetical protein
VLAQFSGLTVGRCGAGEECARSDIRFCPVGPSEPEISTWSGLLGTALIGIAEYHHAHGELYIDSQGRVFSLSLIHDAFSFEGDTFDEAVERLLLGRRARPMFRPDQESVMLYGERYRHEHPSVYHY